MFVCLHTKSFFTNPFCHCRSIYLKKTSATVPQPRDPFHEQSPEDFQVCFLSICLKFVVDKDPLWSQRYVPSIRKMHRSKDKFSFIFLFLEH